MHGDIPGGCLYSGRSLYSSVAFTCSLEIWSMKPECAPRMGGCNGEIPGLRHVSDVVRTSRMQAGLLLHNCSSNGPPQFKLVCGSRLFKSEVFSRQRPFLALHLQAH